MQREGDKVGNKTANKEEMQRKKKDKKSPNFGSCALYLRKARKLFNYVLLEGKYASFVAKLSHPLLC